MTKKLLIFMLAVISSIVFFSCANQNGPISQVDEPITASDLEATLDAIDAVPSPVGVTLSVPETSGANIDEDNIDGVNVSATGIAGTTYNAERTGNSIRDALQIDENANFTLGTPTAEVNESDNTMATIRIPVNPNSGYALESGLTGYTFVLTLSAGNWVENYTLKSEDFATDEISVSTGGNDDVFRAPILESGDNVKEYFRSPLDGDVQIFFNADLTIARIIEVLSEELTPTQKELFTLRGPSGITISEANEVPNAGLTFNIEVNLLPGVVQPSAPLAFEFTSNFPDVTDPGNSGAQGSWVRN